MMRLINRLHGQDQNANLFLPINRDVNPLATLEKSPMPAGSSSLDSETVRDAQRDAEKAQDLSVAVKQESNTVEKPQITSVHKKKKKHNSDDDDSSSDEDN